jgi:copper(I)-binding protein
MDTCEEPMKMQKRAALVFAVALLFLGSCSSGAAPGSGEAGIQVSDAWLRAVPGMAANMPGMPTPEPTRPSDAARMAPLDLPIYMKIRNSGKQNDRLLRAETDIAPKVELHTMEMQGGQMKMTPVDSIEIPAGGKVELQSGGAHIMLFGITREPKVGDVISLTLQFEKAGTVPVRVEVRRP